MRLRLEQSIFGDDIPHTAFAAGCPCTRRDSSITTTSTALMVQLGEATHTCARKRSRAAQARPHAGATTHNRLVSALASCRRENAVGFLLFFAFSRFDVKSIAHFEPFCAATMMRKDCFLLSNPFRG